MINFNNARFETSVFDTRKMNVPRKPEIVFAGRSNVGKSSMINALLNRKNLAFSGSTPGKTESVNFFNVDSKIYFTDLPGYGFAKRSKEQRKGWGSLIGKYLDSDRDIRMIVLLVDSRHEPSEDDFLMYDYLMEKEFLFCVAATKIDKLSKTEAKNTVEKLSRTFGINVIPFSSKTKEGVKELLQITEDITQNEQQEK